MQGTKKLAVAMAATSIAAVGGGIGAAGAQAQNEVLQGTATTISGQASGSCASSLSKSVGAYFNAAGTATGPYSGQFTETRANGGVSGHQKPFEMQPRLYIPFTIRSGTTTITGTVHNGYPWGVGWVLCSGSALVGFGANAPATYTATIQRLGQPAQTISGNAQARGSFYIQPGTETTVTETLAFP